MCQFKTFVTAPSFMQTAIIKSCYLMIAVCMPLSCDKGFDQTRFYVWYRPALSYLWDVEHFCSKKKLTIYDVAV